MNEQLRDLFALVARNGAINAENAMELIKEEEDTSEEEIQTLIKTRDGFSELEDKILSGKEITHIDYALLYIGAIISRNILQKNIVTWNAIVQEYDDNLIPKLKEIATEPDDTRRATLTDELLS